MAHSRAQEQAELVDLRRQAGKLQEENAKLKEVEEQFWLLLQEREDLQQQLDAVRANAGSAAAQKQQQAKAASASPARGGGGGGVSTNEAARLIKEHESMQTALQECMDLLLAKEADAGHSVLGGTGNGIHHQHRGVSVADFLAWLELERGRAEAGLSTEGLLLMPDGSDRDRAAPSSFSPSRGKSGLTPIAGAAAGPPLAAQERATMLNQLSELRQEVGQLQEELDRTDMSRVQALEDSDRLHGQVKTLSETVIELRHALHAERQRCQANEQNALAALQLRGQIADREAEIAKLEGSLAQYRRLADVGSEQLAADAARIRAEFASRKQAAAGSGSDLE